VLKKREKLKMAGLRIFRIVLLALVLCGGLLLLPAASLAQSESANAATQPERDIDLEVQLNLLVASNAATGESAKLSAPLEAIARELRPLLPFMSYKLGATFLGWVKNGRPLSIKGVGRSLLVTPALESSVNPTFYDISAGAVTLKADAGGREVVQLAPFRFGLRIPLQTGMARSDSGAAAAATVNYEGVGINTDVTMREGEPIVVGTLDAGRPNETLVLVLIAKRASMR
jgi:hypothetical protein